MGRLFPLIITDEIRQSILAIKQYAEKNVYTAEDMLKIKKGTLQPAGDDQDFVVMMGVYRVVYTLEEQPAYGLCHHISVSLVNGEKDRGPAPVAVEVILKAFGIRPLKDSATFWPEPRGDNGTTIVNVVSQVNPSTATNN